MKAFFSIAILVVSFNSFGSVFKNYGDTVTSLADKANCILMIEEGKKMFETGRYKDAMTKFREAAIRDPRNSKAPENIAKCHFALKNYGLSLRSALKSYQLDPKNAETTFILAETYTRTGNLDSALVYIMKAEELMSKSTIKDLQLQVKKDGIKFALEQQTKITSKKRERIVPMALSVNSLITPFNEYGFIVTPDGKFAYFTGRRSNTMGGNVSGSDQEYFEDIYKATWNETDKIWDSITNNVDRLNSIGFDAVSHFQKGGYVYLTVNTDGLGLKKKKATQGADICIAEFTDKRKWTTPKRIKEINTSFYEGCATLTEDGNTMYFVSDRRGDKSSTDIYVSTKNGNNWSNPKPVSDSINTIGRETTPFISADGRFLFFSSDGHIGFGGYDIYVSEFDGKTYSKPRNLGPMVNTFTDDTHFRMDDKTKLAYMAGIELIEGKGTIDIFTIGLEGTEFLKK